jgi:hypothetical protein
LQNHTSSGENIYSLKDGNPNSHEYLATTSIMEQLHTNNDLAYINFTIKIKDQGEGISKEGINNLFIDF